MRTNTVATLYNSAKYNGMTVWVRTVLRNVFWEDGKHYNFRTTGLTGSDTSSVFVPFSVNADGKKYVKPKEYARSGDPHGAFTFAPKDYIVKGECDYEHSADTPISALLSTHDDVLTIVGVDTNDFGDSSLQHWEVMGK